MLLNADPHDDSTVPPTNVGQLLNPSDGEQSPYTAGQTHPPRFKDYDLITEVGRGGMGVVYRARQRSLDRIVALKMILAGRFATRDEVRRFQAEARAAASLNHPGIVQVFEVDSDGEAHFFSMEYIDGQSMAERIVDGPVPPDEAASIIQAAAGAIAFAHDNGVIHRDIKPANIIVDRHGQPRITDFGLARLESTSGETGLGELVGTVSYMPPEQAAGESVSPLSDVYSLGATLYSLLVGHPPFHSASTADTIMQVIHKEPVRLRQLNSSVPRDLETICLKCLEKQPSHRYSTASELALDLRRYLDHEPIAARPAGFVTQIVKWTQRNPRIASLASVLTFAVLALFATSVIYNAQLSVERQHALEAERRAHNMMEISSQLLATLDERRASGAGLVLMRATNLGRLCTAASELAETQDRDAVDSAIQAFEREAVWFSDDLNRPLVESITDLNAVVATWQSDPAPADVSAAVATLQLRAREAWLSEAASERTASSVQNLVAARLAQTVELILVSGSRDECEDAISRFRRQQRGVVPVVGLQSLADECAAVDRQLRKWSSGPPPTDLAKVAGRLRDMAMRNSFR